MTFDIPALADAEWGTTSTGVPFVALPPEVKREARGLVILWHGGDPPRTEDALAAAVPMRAVPAWRVYLGLPLCGRRLPEGGFDEVIRRGSEDAIRLLFHPIIAGGVAELPDAVNDVRARLGIDAGLPLGIFGFSMGGAAALLAVSRQLLPFRAAVTWGALPDLRVAVDTLAPFYNVIYEWNDERRALAEEISAAQRAGALAASGAAILLGVGAEDPYPARELAEPLAAAIRTAGGSAEVRLVPGIAHAFVDEPGTAALPQGPPARAVDRLASDWFSRHLT